MSFKYSFMKIAITKNIYALPQTNEIEINRGKLELIKVEPITMQLLEYLINNKGKICTIKELIDNIWEGNTHTGKPALRKNIYKLRKVLKENDINDYILTIPKKGYRYKPVNDLVKINRFLMLPKIIYLIGLIILIFAIIKLIFPGILHWFSHRFFH